MTRFSASASSPLSCGRVPTTPTQTERQATYLRALGTLPGLEIHYGEFRERIKDRPLARPKPGGPTYVRIRDTEEKGSDVNLAHPTAGRRVHRGLRASRRRVERL